MIVKVILKSFLVFIILMFSTVSYAAEVTMAWDASSGDPAGYRIYFGTSTGVYTGNVDVGNITEYTLPDSTNANPVLIKWELSALPADASVQSAILYLYQSGYIDTGKDDLYEISVHKIINHNPDISKCTWSTYDGVNSWTGGADGGQGDVAAAEDIKMVDKAVGYKLWEVTQMVRDWVSNPTANFGMMLLSDQGENKASLTTNRVFVPTENADAGKRPKLVITYSVSEVIAPPAPPGGLRVISP